MGCIFKKNHKHKITKALLRDVEGLRKAEPRASPSGASWEILHYTFPLPGPLSVLQMALPLPARPPFKVVLPLEKNSPQSTSITLFSFCPLSCTDTIFTNISSTCLLSIFTTRMSTHEKLCLVQQCLEPGTMFAT